MSWNSNNRAHACLWTFETWHSKQRDAGFDDVGEWRTDYIIGYAAGAGAGMRSQNAQVHAELLDNAFISLFRASYENSVNQDSAIASMFMVLNNSSKKMADLADAVDAAYRFRGEI